MQSKHKILSQFAMSTLLAAMLTACGGGGGSGGGSNDEANGQVALGITDAEGDFLTYSVDVRSIKLVKANGTTVEVVPNNTRIDFAQYTDVTEFFSIATVPAGEYVSATLVLDYSSAEIFVEDSAGDAVPAAPVDANGDPVTTVEMSIDLADDEPLEVVRGGVANMVIDFDLAASNEVTSWAPVQVTVDSVLVADVQWDGSRELRARGLLDAVDVASDSFSLHLLPFQHRNHHGEFGDATVNVDAETVYHIDGVDYVGADGLAALAALSADTPVVVLGDVTDADDVHSYTAEYVYAGTSVPWAGRDGIQGTVLARQGDSLIVRGIAVDGDDGYEYFHDDIVVNLAPDTEVTRQIPSLSALSIDDISVGSRVQLVGDLFAAGDASVIDTTAGHVHLLVSEVTGQVNDVDLLDPVAQLSIDVANINRRDVSIYNFAGTGLDATSDAAPTNYEINTQSMLLEGINVGELVMLRGFPTAFGTAPADFVAYSVTDPVLLPESAHLILTWPHGSTTAIVSLSDSEIVVDSAGSNEVFKVCGEHREDEHNSREFAKPGNGHGNSQDGDDDDDASNPNASTGSIYTIVPTENGVYSIKRRGGHNVKLYGDFATFSQALAAELAADKVVRQVHVKGSYDSETGDLAAESVNVVIK